jgi:hypothetical protein
MNSFETLPERMPTKVEILEQIRRRNENTKVIEERRDEAGIYLLLAQTPEDPAKPGDYTVYVYHRKGTFPEQAASAVTQLEAVYYSGGQPCGGENVAELDPVSNEWRDVV